MTKKQNNLLGDSHDPETDEWQFIEDHPWMHELLGFLVVFGVTLFIIVVVYLLVRK